MASNAAITTFVAAGSTLATTLINKKLNLGMAECTAINTIATILGTSIITGAIERLPNMDFHNIFGNLWIFLLILSVAILVYKFKDYFTIMFINVYAHFYMSAEIRGQNVDRFVRYIGNFQKFYKFTNFVMDDVTISYDKIRTPITFRDTNYGVTGTIKFIEETKEVKNGDKTETERTTIIKLDNCRCTDIAKCKDIMTYIQNVLMYKYEGEIKNFETRITGNNFVSYTKYINLNKKFFHDDQNVLSEDDDLKVNIFFDTGKTVSFHDSRFNVSGFISWKDKTIFLKNCHLEQPYTIGAYISDVCKFVKESELNTNKIVLYKVDRSRGGGKTTVMYNGPVQSVDELQAEFIDTLFHPDIEKYWSHIKTINYEPDKIRTLGQAPRINLLLHGPPGTGKSTFAYRVARATKRHIINIKLSTIKKDELITLFTAPKIESQQCTPRDIVYVLDEIDIDIEKMLFKQERQKEQCAMAKETIQKLVNATINDQQRDQTKQQSSSVIVVGQQGDDKKQQGQKTDLDPVKSTLDTVNNLEKIIDSITKAYDRIGTMESDLVTLGDLLTVFQGSVPIDGCIIIAMTNDYKKINEICPAMFRAGRLSPVYFGNFDMEMLDRVVKKYFGVGIEYDENIKIEVPPSEIIEMVTPAMIQKMGHKQFIEKLHEKIPEVHLTTSEPSSPEPIEA